MERSGKVSVAVKLDSNRNLNTDEMNSNMEQQQLRVRKFTIMAHLCVVQSVYGSMPVPVQ